MPELLTLFELTIDRKPVGRNKKILLNFIHQINEMNSQTPGFVSCTQFKKSRFIEIIFNSDNDFNIKCPEFITLRSLSYCILNKLKNNLDRKQFSDEILKKAKLSKICAFPKLTEYTKEDCYLCINDKNFKSIISIIVNTLSKVVYTENREFIESCLMHLNGQNNLNHCVIQTVAELNKRLLEYKNQQNRLSVEIDASIKFMLEDNKQLEKDLNDFYEVQINYSTCNIRDCGKDLLYTNYFLFVNIKHKKEAIHWLWLKYLSYNESHNRNFKEFYSTRLHKYLAPISRKQNFLISVNQFLKSVFSLFLS
jgi:hypothetical protein